MNLTDNQLKLIYEYMKIRNWDYRRYEIEMKMHPEFLTHPLDSNDAWEVVQELDRKGDTTDFNAMAEELFWEYLNKQKVGSLYPWHWLYNPDNFFECLGEFLEQREGK